MPSAQGQTTPIPEPKGALPIIGHMAEFKESFMPVAQRLYDTYGPIIRLRFADKKTMVLVSNHTLVNEVLDETRFQKTINTELRELRHLANDGLFTAEQQEETWGIAHRILMPAFGPMSIRGMFDEMHDIASQLTLKWARHGPKAAFSVTEDFTRLAFDTVALCSMGFRLNSFYSQTPHVFVESMADCLTEAGLRFQRPAASRIFFRAKGKKFFKDIKVMRDTADEIVQSRKAECKVNGESPRNDLLAAMMNGVDAKTGRKMDDNNIIDNLITFLIAGHETTSGTLSFLFYQLLKNPECYYQAQKEVDEIMGRDPITVEKIFQLKYIPAALRETLRLCSPIPGISVEALQDTVLAGKYPVKAGEPIAAMFTQSHVDPEVYGEDAASFRPERMFDEPFAQRQKEFPSGWKPFGSGVRACIGRPFAWQEMLLAVSMLLQSFNLSMADPSYNLQIAETLTIKPKDFTMRASLRHGMTPLELEKRLQGRWTGESGPSTKALSRQGQPQAASSQEDGIKESRPISIFYGSNSGTCEALAQQLAKDAASRGFVARAVDAMDTARDELPPDHPVVFVTSSYEGEPPDNAAHFVTWLKGLAASDKSLSRVSYAVFGCGNREWAHTFHKIPKLVDSALEEQGAERLADIGLSDTSEGDPFLDFENWENKVLWPSLVGNESSPKEEKATASAATQMGLSIEITAPRSSTLRQDVSQAIVTSARDLTASAALQRDVGVGRKRHIEIKLPTGMTYRAGDYVSVLPMNPQPTVQRALRHFKLSWDAVLTIHKDEQAAATARLPLEQPVSVQDILSSYVELGQPATRRDLRILLESANGDKNAETQLEEILTDKFNDEITKKRASVLDLLEKFVSLELPFGTFLGMLPPMRIRQYSIASSPLQDPTHVCFTYSVLDSPGLSGHGRHLGVASNYLASLNEGDSVYIAIRPSHVAFHLPAMPESTPIICAAAGSGIGPFRGFVEERATQIAAGRKLAPAVLFYGCKGTADDLYRDEFDAWEEMGAVAVRRAYSRETGGNEDETKGCRYVQDRMLAEQDEIVRLWDDGAKLFVCGGREMGHAVEQTCLDLLVKHQGMDEAEAKVFMEQVRNERFATDVFS